MNIRTATIKGVHNELRIRDAVRGIHLAASVAPAADGADLRARAEKVAAVAALHAAAVDSDLRFPSEAIAAARAERLLGLAVPRELGGEGFGIADVADVCYALGRACASTAMIYAMHQTKVACLVRHGRGSPWHQLLLRRLCAEQLLLASSTTEGQAGGDVRNSSASIDGDARITLERQATVISYGEAADGIVTTARRSADAASNDQVLVALLKEDYTLERLNGWDAFGMRGTCSSGFKLVASGLREQILPVSYEKIHSQTMMPFAHLAWSSAWAGIAASAVDRARAFVRKAAHRSGGTLPPGAAHLTRASATLADAAQPGCLGVGPLRSSFGRSGSAGICRLSDRHEPAQGECVGARGLDRHERDAGLRARGLPQRRRIQHGPPSARHPVVADHDQQRPHPRQRRGGVFAGGHAASLRD